MGSSIDEFEMFTARTTKGQTFTFRMMRKHCYRNSHLSVRLTEERAAKVIRERKGLDGHLVPGSVELVRRFESKKVVSIPRSTIARRPSVNAAAMLKQADRAYGPGKLPFWAGVD